MTKPPLLPGEPRPEETFLAAASHEIRTPLNGILGSQGERWAALNSKVPHSDAERLIAATEAAIDPYRERMAASGVTMSFLYIAIAQHVFSYEPVLRWFDEWLPVHHHVPEPDFLSGLEEPQRHAWLGKNANKRPIRVCRHG